MFVYGFAEWKPRTRCKGGKCVGQEKEYLKTSLVFDFVIEGTPVHSGVLIAP